MKTVLLWSCLLLVCACSSSDNQTKLFHLLPADVAGIHFSNRITENDTMNILKEEYVYNGGGVGIGDFNNDGFQDVFFSGNMVANALYLNTTGKDNASIQFKDITAEAKIEGDNRWCSGVAVVDINEDGWPDIYVSATMYKDAASRANLLYINNGLNENGVPTFTESAAAYGIADTGNTTQAAFFDYDNDGDLDLYLLTNVIDTRAPVSYREKVTNGSATNNDRLYRNDGSGSAGHPTFTDVSKEAGITIEGYGLGITVSDINNDGWADIYITNDYLSNDLLYINNQDGTFTNKVGDYLRHQSYSAMGNDVVDFNNDGLVDIIALDMLPESNARKKQMIGANNYTSYINNDKYGYQPQYVRNTLQLNNGITPNGELSFSEIGLLAGIYQTDWSWSPLVADFDNDGFKDVIITNGFPKDVTDRDFASYRSGPAGGVASNMMLQDDIPVVKTSNYAFKNNGATEGQSLTFTDKTKEWGLDIPSFSNGAAYADLDNDGDLDVVINNIDDSAFVYENTLYNKTATDAENHYLNVKMAGNQPNQRGVGAKVMIKYDSGKVQYFENALYRGYLSTMENVAHFGLGNATQVDSLHILWPDGTSQLLLNVQANQLITLKQADAKSTSPATINQELPLAVSQPLFREVSASHNVSYKHEEEDRIDFNLQRTLPQKYTQSGPGIAVGDINGDQLDDFYIGGSAGNNGTLFVQQKDGSFAKDSKAIQHLDTAGEQMGVLLFDADSDGDLDLYAVSGSYEFQENAPELQDHLYLNDGKGQFTLSGKALPEFHTSGSCVKAADFDQDGDLDLFVGGRVVPGQYPKPASSYILRNDKGTFTDVTASICPALQDFGMVSDALWTDFDGDGRIDLLIAAEWQPLTFFKNTDKGLANVTDDTGIAGQVGWWNSLTSGDFDNDGDIDYIAGNLGLNTTYKASEQYPLSVYAKDFDENGGYDAVLVCYIKDATGNMQPYPVHSRDDMISQMIKIRRDFPKYEQYGRATIDSIFTKEQLKGAVIYHANHMESSYIENMGGGKFSISALPMEAQIAPLYGMVSQDVDGDGNLDLLAVGNNYGTEVFTGRYDALTGLLLKGDGKGKFTPMKIRDGWYVPGDAKGLALLKGADNENIYLATQNQDSLKMYATPITAKQTVALEPMDAWAAMTMKDGSKCKVEFYYGSTYLSQSTRHVDIGENVAAVTIYDFSGKSRQLNAVSIK